MSRHHTTDANAADASGGPAGAASAWRDIQAAITDTQKSFCRGTHRMVAPEDTLARVRPHMAAMGITRIANVTGLDRVGVPVVMVCRPNARSLAVSQGKGLTLDAAKASGLMECAELHHAEHITLPLVFSTLGELRRSYRLIDVRALPRLSASRFDEHLRTLWIQGLDLMNGQPTLVPYEMVHTDYTLPMPPGSGCFVMSTNGLASGNHLFEAIGHALCEVVERDANTLWSLAPGGRARTRLDLATVDDPPCRSVLERFAEAELAVAVWDITSDVGIPAFHCLIAEREPDPLRPLPAAAGAGCAPSRDIALLRALTEAAQSRLTHIAGSRDDMSVTAYGSGHDMDTQASILAEMRAGTPARRFDHVPTFFSDSFAEDLSWALERLRSVGIRQVVAVDLTKHELGIPVVRVIIPGLEAMWDIPGYIPGRRARARLARAGRAEQAT